MDSLSGLNSHSMPESSNIQHKVESDSTKTNSIKDRAFKVLKICLTATLAIGLVGSAVALVFLAPEVAVIALLAMSVLGVSYANRMKEKNDKLMKIARYEKVGNACDQTLGALKPFSRLEKADPIQVQQQMEQILEISNKFYVVTQEKKDIFSREDLTLTNLQTSCKSYSRMLKDESITDPDVLEDMQSTHDDFFAFLEDFKKRLEETKKTCDAMIKIS